MNPHPRAPRDSSGPHSEGAWLQPATDDIGRDAPEAIVYQDTGKEVKPEQEKEHYIAAVPPQPVQPDRDVVLATEGRRPKILGLRRRSLLISAIVLILVIVGAVLGGVLGSRSSHDSGNTQPSGLPASTSGISSTAPPVSTSSPTSTPGLVEKADFKFPSIALTGSGLPRLTKLFTLHSANNSVTLHIKDPSGWQAWGQVSLNVPPFKGSPLAAASWIDGDYDQIRLYYIDANTELVELAAQCQNTIDCDWNGEKSLVRTGVSNSSSLGISQWGDATSAAPIQIHLYYVDENNYLQELDYNGAWSDPTTPGQTIGQDSGLAAEANNATDTLERLFYTDPNGDLVGLRRTLGYAFALTDATFTNPADKPTVYNLATCLYPSTDLSVNYLTVKQIVEDRSVAEAWKIGSVGGWTTTPSMDAISGNWAQGDDVGGAIACTGWIGPNGKANQLLVYSVGGVMTEYWLNNGNWSQAAIFK